jgi:hypothetical protein
MLISKQESKKKNFIGLISGRTIFLFAIIFFILTFLFGSFNIVSATDIASCPYTISSSGYYLITSNLSSTGNCITINANDVHLNCSSNWIHYATTESGLSSSGIINNGNNNIIDSNCNLEHVSGTNNVAGIYVTFNTYNTTLEDIIVHDVGSTYSYGVYLSGDSINLLDSWIGMNQTSYYSRGLELYQARNFYGWGNLIIVGEAHSTSCWIDSSNNVTLFAGYCAAELGHPPSYSLGLKVYNTTNSVFNHTQLWWGGVSSNMLNVENSRNNIFNDLYYSQRANNLANAIKLINSSDNRFTNSLINMPPVPATYVGDILIDILSLNNTFENMKLISYSSSDNTIFSIDNYGGEKVSINTTEVIGPLPPIEKSMKNFINISTIGSVHYVLLKLHYTHLDLLTYGINESSIKIFGWDGTDWLDCETGLWCDSYGLDTSNNYAWANITSPGPYSLLGQSLSS